ncbi:MAG: alpha-hydroxy-acid oxidizing enzyme [Betaproteobacteria bacterium HGW-Betaproteobacteria-11]|nr:MAG: alpha-hydroxy-acid oxidizing enzyme [Betaproteobacteria bacterium HGW-Betaproteobacteria-11]
MALQRTFHQGTDFRRALSIAELRLIARRRVPHFAFEYVDSGAQDEITLRRNRSAFEAIGFIPPTLCDTSARQQRTRLFGAELSSPLVVAPTALNGLLHRQGDLALARAAKAAGIPFTLATLSTVTLERVAREVGGRLWMQLYLMQDRRVAREIIARAEAAGFEALVLTSDANVFGQREWDRRNYRAPGQLNLRNLLDVARHPGWLWQILWPHGIPRFANVASALPPEARSARAGVAHLPRLMLPDISWQDLAWVREAWPRTLILKGVLTVADAERAARHGCDGIVLTNHGGRQLDGTIAPLEVLPEIAEAVGKQLTLLIDSGFRRGTDVVKALALGADGVMLGAATLYGLAAGGEAGVTHALDILRGEIDRTLGQLGCNSIAELGPHLLKNSSR